MGLMENSRAVKYRNDREASLEESLDDGGISWGMADDASEECEDDEDEITWQTFKGRLTEKQEKTRDKVTKRYSKITNMRKEIDAIRAKDIAQGGLTQGQQTQIARNEQKMSQIMDELESLEETLNESIRESISSRSGKISRFKKSTEINEEEFPSDEDEFYDRTVKKVSSKKSDEHQQIETLDSLLSKRNGILTEIKEKKLLLMAVRNRRKSEVAPEPASEDALDAYMSGVTSCIVMDKATELERQVSGLQSELDKVEYLLKIADPTGEASKKNFKPPKDKYSDPGNSFSQTSSPPLSNKPLKEKTEEAQSSINSTAESEKEKEPETVSTVEKKPDSFFHSIQKPLWLGATDSRKKENRDTREETPADMAYTEGFVDYKDRKKILSTNKDEGEQKEWSTLENMSSGLIIRKRKQVDGPDALATSPIPTSAQTVAEGAVALLLKHSRGRCHTSEDESGRVLSPPSASGDGISKKMFGAAERPSFLEAGSDYEPWMPPEGQSGDGRTLLNERYGY